MQVTVARELGIDPGEPDALRATFHRVVNPSRSPAKIEQLTPYVGGAGGGPGREFPIQAGVAGRAATTGKPRILQFSSASSINQRVDALTEWGYTKDDALEAPGRGPAYQCARNTWLQVRRLVFQQALTVPPAISP